MEEKVFPVLQGLAHPPGGGGGAGAGRGAGGGGRGAAGAGLGLVAASPALMLGLAGLQPAGLLRQPWVVKLGPKGVDVCLATGRVMHAGWGEIEAHTITPGGRIGALLVRSGKGKARVRVLPISTRLMGAKPPRRLLAALKERLPKLEYRVPSVGGVNPG